MAALAGQPSMRSRNSRPRAARPRPGLSAALLAALALALGGTPLIGQIDEATEAGPRADLGTDWRVELLLAKLPYPMGDDGCKGGVAGAGLATGLQRALGEMFSVRGGLSVQMPVVGTTCNAGAAPYNYSAVITDYPEAFRSSPLLAADARLVLHPPGTGVGLTLGGGWLWFQQAPYFSSGARVRIHRLILLGAEMRGYGVTGERFDRQWEEGELIKNESLGERRDWVMSPAIRATVAVPLPFW